MELGEEIHRQLEEWYLRGRQPLDKSALRLLQNKKIPQRGENYDVEQPKDYGLGISAAGVPVRGRIDLLVRRPDLVQVWDWKTSGNLQFVKTDEELPRVPQMGIYGRFAVAKHGAKAVQYFHGNIWTKGEGASVTESEVLTANEVIEIFDDVVVPAVERLKITAAAPSLSDVRVNTKSCFAYKQWCPYIEHCPEGKAKRYDGMDEDDSSTSNTEVTEMTLQERLDARRKTQGATGINPPDAAPVDVPTPYAPPATTTATTPPVTEVVTRSDGNGLTLLIDTQPIKGVSTYTLLSDEITRRTPGVIASALKKHAGKMPADANDVRLVPYGEGVAELAQSFIREPLRGVVVAYTGGITSNVLDVLVAQAAFVYRG
jgi:hypothetical protein